MKSAHIDRAKNAILGAFVADAATMGLHWLYSQPRLLELAPQTPEFRPPTASDYAGNVGYFAHEKKSVGEFSHYGEQTWVLLRAMLSSQGQYDRHQYQDAFRAHFGYGGAFVGYIDRPTRQTLDTLYQNENQQITLAHQLEFSGDDKQRSTLLIKILAAAKRYTGERLVEEATRMAQELPHPEESLRYSLALVSALAATEDYPGADDEQLPALSKLPPLIARHADDANLMTMVTSAIRVTNNAPRAIDYGQVASHTLRDLILGKAVASAIETGLQAGSAATQVHLRAALAETGTVLEVTAKYGLNCDVGRGMASLLHNLQSADSFTSAIRQNILAGGDNCGRSIMLGAACGAAFGVGGEQGIPRQWIAQLADPERLLGEIDRLFE